MIRPGAPAHSDGDPSRIETLRENSNRSLNSLLDAHAELEQARRVIMAYTELEIFQPLVGADGNSSKLDSAVQFYSSLGHIRSQALGLAQEYEKLCEERSLQCNAIHQQSLRALYDAVGSDTDIARRLPDEIVARVFFWTFEPTTWFILLDICRVSSRWRAVALSNPSLWNCLSISVGPKFKSSHSSVDRKNPKLDSALIGPRRPSLHARHCDKDDCQRYISDPEHVHEWVARAGALPLHLHLVWAPNEEILPAWQNILDDIAPRLESMIVENDLSASSFRSLFVTPLIVGCSFPKLRVLDLMNTSLDFCSLDRFRFDTPNLHSLFFSRGNFGTADRKDPVDWTSLSSIRAVDTNEDGMLVLLHQTESANSSLPIIRRLHSLRVTLPDLCCPVRKRLVKRLEKNPAVLSSLKVLDVVVDSYFTIASEAITAIPRAMRAPNLHKLTLQRVQKRIDVSAEDMAAYLEALVGTPQTPHCARLAVLTLDKVYFTKDEYPFKAIFRAIRTLEELHLRQMPVSRIISALSQDDDTIDGKSDGNTLLEAKALLPNLRTFTLREAEEITPDSIEELLRYRGLVSNPIEYRASADRQCVPLEHVQVDGTELPLRSSSHC